MEPGSMVSLMMIYVVPQLFLELQLLFFHLFLVHKIFSFMLFSTFLEPQLRATSYSGLVDRSRIQQFSEGYLYWDSTIRTASFVHYTILFLLVANLILVLFLGVTDFGESYKPQWSCWVLFMPFSPFYAFQHMQLFFTQFHIQLSLHD